MSATCVTSFIGKLIATDNDVEFYEEEFSAELARDNTNLIVIGVGRERVLAFYIAFKSSVSEIETDSLENLIKPHMDITKDSIHQNMFQKELLKLPMELRGKIQRFYPHKKVGWNILFCEDR